MCEEEKSRYVEGIVYRQYTTISTTLGLELESSDTRWVLALGNRSPYEAFAGRRVMATGERYEPESKQRRLWRAGEKPIWYFRASIMRLAEVTPDAWLIEIGAEQRLTGRFECGPGGAGESALCFVTDGGATFLVANDPPGAVVGRIVSEEVDAYPVLLSRPKSPLPYLWVFCRR